MRATHNDLEYVEIAAPADRIRLLWPANTFSARLTADHAEITISTDLAGIPAVLQKLDALAAFMAINMKQPELIERYEVGAAQGMETATAGETEGLDPKGDSPVGNADAPTPSTVREGNSG